MCLVRPRDREEMLSVTGVGEYKYEKYGEAFLEQIADFNRKHGKTDELDSLGAVDFSSLDYDVMQDYEQ